MAVPGMEMNELNPDMDHNVLTISCEKKKKEKRKDNKIMRCEVEFTMFQRSFTLPETINQEKIGAVYKDGLLQISLSKKSAEERKTVKNIQIY